MKVTIKELLKKTPKKINNDLDFLAGPYYNHLPEAFFGQDQNETFPWWTHWYQKKIQLSLRSLVLWWIQVVGDFIHFVMVPLNLAQVKN